MTLPQSRFLTSAALLGGLAGLVALANWPAVAQDKAGPSDSKLDKRILEAEKKRVAVIEKVKPSVVAIFGPGGNGGGSGVLIDEEGYALTNYHVTAGAGNVMKCGLPDGVLYDAVLVGQDKVGDVALVKLYPKKAGQKFPFAKLGDSDKLKPGDWSLAMGNPFLLATDFTPTVTFGLISGTHRYQYPGGGWLLEYTDCIQIDTSINPGNSGGPLFNMDGELVGINGRGSFEKRGRVNSGVGYAISINQIKNFMGHLRVGLDADHASLGANIEVDRETYDGANPFMVVTGMLDCDASRRGLESGDQLVQFAGRPMSSLNMYKNTLGLYPRDWRVPLTLRRKNSKKEILVRLMGVQRRVVGEGNNPEPQPQPQPPPGRPGRPTPPVPSNSPVAKYYKAKAGFANFYFNEQARDVVLAKFKKIGDFSAYTGDWVLKAGGEADGRATTMDLIIHEEDKKTVCKMTILGLEYELEPLKSNASVRELRAPAKSGGLILALYHYRQMLVMGPKGFVGEFSHGGHEPFYALPEDGEKTNYKKQLVMTEVLRTRHAGVTGKWYFSLKDGTLLGFEIWSDREEDPCEVYLSNYKDVEGMGKLPQRIQVRHGDGDYADLKRFEYKLSKGK